MICDSIENIGRYSQLHQVKEFDLSHWEKGRFEISGDSFFGIGLEYTTKDERECLWEAHRRNLDVHVILEGEELIHISAIDDAAVTKEYDETGDYALFEAKKQHGIILKKGMFLALYPNEVHRTAVTTGVAQNVKKTVFKIAL